MTQPLSFGEQLPPGRRFTRTQWIAGNLVASALICAVGAPGFDGVALAVLGSLCLVVPMRAVGALLEWYLVRQYAYRPLVISHLIGLVLGISLGAVREPAATTEAGIVISPVTGAILGYLMFSLAALGCSAVVTLVRAMRRGGPPVPPEPRSFRTMSAHYWLNAVSVVVVTILVAPSMVEPGQRYLVAGLGPALIFALAVRLPGAAAEWQLTKRAQHRVVYGVHVFAALVTVPVALIPVPDSAPLGLGGAVGLYLLIAAFVAWLAVAVAWPVRAWRRRHGPPSETRRLEPSETRRPGPSEIPWPEPSETRRLEPSETRRPGLSEMPWPEPSGVGWPGDARTEAWAPSPGHSHGQAHPPLGHPAGQPAPQPGHSAGRPAPPPDPAGPPEPAGRLGAETLAVLGFAIGLASLVQGYDRAELGRTVVLALLVGGLGMAAYYYVNRRR